MYDYLFKCVYHLVSGYKTRTLRDAGCCFEFISCKHPYLKGNKKFNQVRIIHERANLKEVTQDLLP